MTRTPLPPFPVPVPPGVPVRPPRLPRLTHELTFLRRSLEVMANPPADPTLRGMVSMLTTITDALRTLVQLAQMLEALKAAGEPLAKELDAALESIAADVNRIRSGESPSEGS